MLSENKLETRTLGDNLSNQTTKDTQGARGDDAVTNAIKLGVVAATSFALFKSGALKDVIKPMMQMADKVAKEGTDKAGVAMTTLKEWSNLRHLSPAELNVSKTQRHNTPESPSIFRDRDSTAFRDLMKDAKDFVESGRPNFANVNNLMEGSIQDVNLLKRMVKEKEANIKNIQSDYTNTDLSFMIDELKEFERTTAQNHRKQQIQFNAKAMEAFMELSLQSSKKAKQELVEMGYRKMTLGDIAELKVGENGQHFLSMKEDSPIDLASRANPKYEDVLKKTNKFFQDPVHKYQKDGKTTSAFMSGDWKNIVVDSGIRIDEKGGIVDYRMSRDNFMGFFNSLANDFKLPVVGFNPFKSLFGMDKWGRREPFIGLISNQQFDSNLTRTGGEKTIQSWMTEKFGKEYSDKGVAVINGKAYTTDKDGNIQEIGSGLRLHDITNSAQSHGLKPMLNATRQMSGLSLGQADKMITKEYMAYYKEKTGKDLGSFKKAKYELGKMLDMGYQEARTAGEDAAQSLDDVTSFDEATNKFINWLTDRPVFQTNGFEYEDTAAMIEAVNRNNYRTVFGKGFDPYTNKANGRRYTPKTFTTTKKGYKLKTAFDKWNDGDNEAAKKEAIGFVAQFGSGRNTKTNKMGEYFTERTGFTWTILNQLSEGLGDSSKLFGFSTESKASPFDLAKNLMLKRALPVYLAMKVPDVFNYYSEPFMGNGTDDGTENRDNITKAFMRNIVKPIDVAAHKVMDFLGATNVFKFLGEMTPGYDQINELPGIYHLGIGQTEKERQEYIEKGYDPVRKGRWWGSGNTPLTGGKIMYYRPNVYRRVEADVKFSDSKWGSRQEYYNNTWFPNPVNPLAPINHFILDRNHYDKKHYKDRPYLQTAPIGQNIPMVGPLFGSTLGKIIGPSQKMHQEYWRQGLRINPEDEKPSSLLTEGTLNAKTVLNDIKFKGTPFNNAPSDMAVYNKIESDNAEKAAVYSQSLYSSAYQAKEIVSKGYIEKSGITFQQTSILPDISIGGQGLNDYGSANAPITNLNQKQYEVYSTPSGNMNVVDVPDDLNLYNVNKDLQKYSISKTIGTNQRVTVSDIEGPDIPVGNDDETIDNAFMYGLGEQYNWAGDIAGLKGFAVQQFITGHPNTKARVIEDSTYAYSFNNDFWSENLGGLGGNLSEITRRFIPKRNNKTDYVNPIRNTMPSWMPGSKYFTDFKHGDPYSKIDNGEERLPGEGYERLNNIKNLMEFNIQTSSIGYSKEKIVKHMLNQDQEKTAFEREASDDDDKKIRGQIQAAWTEAGMAIRTDQEVQDGRNGIAGRYDALVHDRTSKTGVGIAEIKTVSAKKLNELRKSKAPLDEHKREVNYLLWATDNMESRGHVYYVDKTNLNNNLTVSFKYDENLLKDTLDNVYNARQEIRSAVDKGIIGRGELYSDMDRFRILADVAPYSQEFKDAAAKLDPNNMKASEEREASAIRERIKNQKEPLRVYPYKFKTSNLKTETVTVTGMIDNNTIVTKEYGNEHSIKFAGIHVSEAYGEMYDKKHSKAEAASNKIKRYIRPGSRVKIQYDVDEKNQFSKDSTESIRAVVMSRGRNVNKVLLEQGHAKAKENDDSPAAVRARYTKGEIAFGSAMETLTHDVVGSIPFVGSKFMQVRSPYEQYRKREVYSKDFQSWNHPIRDILMPTIDENIANNSFGGLGGIVTGAFIGSIFGRKRGFGKLIGAVIGGTIPAVGKIAFVAGSDKERDWRPKRRVEQEKLNEYVDVLKYVKSVKLYEKYKLKAKKEDKIDVDAYIKSKEAEGAENKLKKQELADFKRNVKLDFKNKDKYNFKYGKPKYYESKMDKKQVISAINREMAEIQGKRKVAQPPKNVLKAIEYRQAAKQTMYGYEKGDSLVNIMTALPKKDRQYFKHFMSAPEEEKNKILRIAPSYMRRALQSAWGRQVDAKPTLEEYFQKHGLPNQNWIGWNEETDMNDVKVKLIHQNKLDPGEFDVWDDATIKADKSNIPIPTIKATNNARAVQARLSNILTQAGYSDVQTNFSNSSNNSKTKLIIKRDVRDDVERQINSMPV